MAALFSNPWYWIIAGTLLAGLEILVPGVLLLWIGLGALAVGLLLTAFPGLPFAGQMLIFVCAMIGSISIGYFIQRHGRSEQDTAPLNHELESLVGRTLVAASDFAVGQGRVKVGDTTYAAVSEHPISVHDAVRVVAIEGGRLRVSPDLPARSMS